MIFRIIERRIDMFVLLSSVLVYLFLMMSVVSFVLSVFDKDVKMICFTAIMSVLSIIMIIVYTIIIQNGVVGCVVPLVVWSCYDFKYDVY